MSIQTLIEEFVENAKKDRVDASATYEELVGNELHTQTSATFFKARQEANKQLMDAAQMMLRSRELEMKESLARKDDEDEADIFRAIEERPVG